MSVTVSNISTTLKAARSAISVRYSLTGPRHLVNMMELSNSELRSLVDLAANFKKISKAGVSPENHSKLMGKLIALLFSKRSTRTRVLTEGAAAFFGAQPMFLGKDDIQLGVNESVLDTTKVLSSMTSCIFARVNSHQNILDLCEHLLVPIINSLCDRYHPLQAITDILTIKETFGKTEGLKLAWIGDANNVINDLLIAALRSGISVLVSIPEGVEFDEQVGNFAHKLASESGLTFEVVHNPQAALKDANVVVTDTWISMGEEDQKVAKLKQFENYQITRKMIASGQAADNWKFMHCLPRHKEEVDDEVFYGEESLVFGEAENRLYAAMAVIDGFVVKKGNL